MNLTEIRKRLKKYDVDNFFDIELFSETTSTNTVLKDMARSGAKEGKTVIALKQTEGRGRMSRSFFSPENTGIYMSVLLKPDLLPDVCAKLTSAAAVAVSDAINALGEKNTEIKWVNDIYKDGKKICGILAESAFGEEGQMYVILGIGINVSEPADGFPDEIKAIAGFLFKSCTEETKERLAAEILKNIFYQYSHLSENLFLTEYKKRSFVIGKNIIVIRGETKKDAYAADIDDNCRLIVKYPDGTTEALFSGEVSIKASRCN